MDKRVQKGCLDFSMNPEEKIKEYTKYGFQTRMKWKNMYLEINVNIKYLKTTHDSSKITQNIISDL